MIFKRKKNKCLDEIQRIIEIDGAYQEKLIDHIRQLSNVIHYMEEHLEEGYNRWQRFARHSQKDAWRMIVYKENLDYLKKLEKEYEVK